jgi:phospholipid-binding lipoprotein MlaA
MRTRLVNGGGLIVAAMLLAPSAWAQETVASPVAAPMVTPPPVVPTVAPPPARGHHTRGDPLEGVNRKFFSIHQFLDRIFFRPVAMVYKTIIPKPVRTGVRHILSNLTEPIVFANDLLQLKPKRAAATFARFTINSTAGIGGVIDVAKSKIPHRDNGFGNTLGRYGIGPGPYLFLPLVGPTDLRDVFGGQVDGATLPVSAGFPFNRVEFQIPHTIVSGLDQRVESDAELKALLAGAADPYATLRSVYLQSRAGEINEIRHGAGATTGLDDPLVDPEATAKPGEPGATATDTPADPEAKPVPGADTPADPEPAGSTPPSPAPGGDDGASFVSFVS